MKVFMKWIWLCLPGATIESNLRPFEWHSCGWHTQQFMQESNNNGLCHCLASSYSDGLSVQKSHFTADYAWRRGKSGHMADMKRHRKALPAVQEREQHKATMFSHGDLPLL
ncbi:MAG: hypothetical protein JEY79_07910 [Pseudodesulfovibrio sp.]|nr:hypothetical protein [Pseudodesulfovibrio sp.]